MTSARVSPYLRRSSWSRWRRTRTSASRSGSSSSASWAWRSSATSVVELDRAAPATGRAPRRREPGPRARPCAAATASRAPSSPSAATAPAAGLPVVLDAGQGVLLGVEPLVLAGVVQGGRGRAPRPGSAGGRPRGHASGRRHRGRPAPRRWTGCAGGPRGAAPGRRAANRSSAARWVGRRQQALVGVLPVQVDQHPAVLASSATVARRPFDVGPRPTLGRDDAAQDELVLAVDEAALDDGLGRAGAHERRVGPPAHQQLDGLDEERLAGAGLAGQRGQPRPEAAAGLGAITPRSWTTSSVSISGRRGRTWPSGSGGSGGGRSGRSGPARRRRGSAPCVALARGWSLAARRR